MAIALAADPDILFADEPTTALDVTIQAQNLDLLRENQIELGTATILEMCIRDSCMINPAEPRLTISLA